MQGLLTIAGLLCFKLSRRQTVKQTKIKKNYKPTRKIYEIITTMCNIVINRILGLIGTISPYPSVQCVTNEKYRASRPER